MSQTTNNPTKKLILSINTSNDFLDFDYIVAELTQADIDKIRKLSEVVKTAKQSIDSAVYRIKMFDHSVTTMKMDYDAEPDEDGKQPLVEPEYGRIDCCSISVSDDDFMWSFYPKHGDMSDLCETSSVPLAELDSFDAIDERE
ncbi:hypothetical protein FY034_18055 (plasmid) [Trichlorobacter lovleyi]|uniref:hypothetical protein n=1 Tax=Trichlorobacter lovleyi TaxID=313985 RepID=UPI00223FCF9A|nr:hypothetical protein [Trichlorobacter lovleyi]QOX80905.1 hypothetical protein FY034_18055 [Trichlorobacter lovleyi]